MELLKEKLPNTWKGRDVLILLLENIFYKTPEERPKPTEIMANIEMLFQSDVAKFKEPTTVESYLWFENRNLLNRFINIPQQHNNFIPIVFSKRRVLKPVEKNVVNELFDDEEFKVPKTASQQLFAEIEEMKIQPEEDSPESRKTERSESMQMPFMTPPKKKK